MNKSKWINALIIIGIPTVYALVLRLLFGAKDWNGLLSVMSISFLFYLPTIVGILTVYLSSEARIRKLAYRIFAPWIPILIFFVLTLIVSLEGWACWLMILPFFLLAASAGGLLGAYFRSKKKNSRTYISFLCLLPLLTSPVEHYIGPSEKVYEAYTSIDIHAPATKIWNNVVRVKAISEQQDKGWLTRFLGFPRPVEAILNYEGVGASRAARFTKGLVFHETVSEYIDKRKMVFSIRANPYEIPSTTMDEHIVVGGQYFDVLNGTYELQRLDEDVYRLHLYSHFRLKTTFNFYASWWATWIMKDIQHNILQVEKYRAERG